MKFNAKDAGYWAAIIGETRDTNPYPEGSEDRFQWFEGFTRWEQEEQKKDDDIARMGGEPTDAS